MSTCLPFFHTSLTELEQLFSYFPDRTGPPPDVPECGFDGGLCERDSQVRRDGKNLMMKMKKYIEILRNVKKCNELLRNIKKCKEMKRNGKKCIEMYRNI